MPAYKPHYLAAALESLRAQTWPNLELVVCDDCRGDRVRELVEAFAATVDFPVHYHRNPERLHESRNAARCVQLARGEYIKFLYDDDLLHPDCIAAQVAAIRGRHGVALVSSRRLRINAGGYALPDTLHTARLFACDMLIDGPSLVDFLGKHTVNFIGEPSAVLCRRADLLAFGDRLMDLDGVPIRWFGDLALYARLLQHGALAFLDRRLSSFRVSAQQFSQIGRNLPGIGDQGLEDFRQGLRKLGWCDESSGTTTPVMAALEPGAPSVAFDLAQALAGAESTANVQQQLHEWRRPRRWNAAQRGLGVAHVGAGGKARVGVVVSAGTHTPAAALDLTLGSLAMHADLLHLRVVVTGIDTVPERYAGAGFGAHVNASPGQVLRSMATEGIDWLLSVQAGAHFLTGGMQRLAMTLPSLQNCRALYADGWHVDADHQTSPLLLPDFDPGLVLANPSVFARHWLFHRDAVLAAPAIDPAAGAVPGLDLVLEVMAGNDAAAIHHMAEPLVSHTPLVVNEGAERQAILQHLKRMGHPRARVESTAAGLYRIEYGHDRQPPVSLVVIASANTALATLERCVVSLLEKTRYPNYELLLIDNGAAAETGQWMQQVETLAAGRVRAFAFDPPLMHAAACNVAATQAAGDYLLFLRPEVAALQPQWLEELLNHGLRPEVGIVGAKTVSADGKITHAGLVPGLLPSGGRAFAGSPMDAPGYMARLQVAQNYSAVADSCLLIGKALFVELEGFDHATFADAGADIDLCLRACQLGHPTVWTPHALLLHSAEVGPLPPAASDALVERWLPALAHDPAYNPSLRLDVPGGFRLGESDFSWRPFPWRPVPRVLAHPADPWGSGHYRVIQPLEALKTVARAEGALYATLLDTVAQARIDPDVVVLQRRVSDEDLERMRRMPRFSRALKVYELDDYLPNLPAKNVHREHMPRDILRSLRRAFGLVDRVVVSTPALAEAFAGMHPDIRIARNRLPPPWWKSLPAPNRNTGAKPRVGWAGGVGHAGDLEMVAGVIAELAGEVDWVFLGMCPERLQPYLAEFHPGVDIATYPRVLARLNLDLSIAPLEQNRFNECKSNLRLLEYGACAVPVVCSDVGPYRDAALPVTRVRNRHRDWVGAIRDHLADSEARAAAGDALRTAVHRDWMLADNGLEEWRAAWLP
ncbi:O-antigen biosynthesis protein [Pseudoxanthomonas broegbernensis]|uniref:O-antigen biosynthesis protein n=2 Tax=Pseudoxanthomonas broegbernensis TaxID=83619 RepID=A0A7V8GLD8_9GAMM|nr:O-antigen biosynthesis protein [Pseudoxanthomonas broegbernensis]